MVNHLGDIKAHYRTLAVPMPSYAMATLPVFALAAGCSAWEAVNYCDVLRSVHDAGELGNLYTVATQEDDEPGPSTRHASTSVLRQNYGYQALVHARHTLATAQVRSNSTEGRGDRIVMEDVTRDETSGTFLVSGLSRVQSGLSFPVPNAPRQYERAMEAAVAGRCGVMEIGPSMAAQEAMPCSLKEAFSSGQSAVALPGLITNSTQFLNQSHLCIHQSFILE
eukprot:Em0016g969a